MISKFLSEEEEDTQNLTHALTPLYQSIKVIISRKSSIDNWKKNYESNIN